MHQAEPYGHLVVNGKPIAADTLARMVGCAPTECRKFLLELEGAGVFSREGEVAVSRRMVRDERIRRLRAEGGKLGGNPALKDNHEVGDKVNLPPNLPPTPSTSVFSLQSSEPIVPSVLVVKDDVPYLRILELYHELLPELPRIAKLTTNRRAQLRARWKGKDAEDLEDWRVFFLKVKASRFLMGKVPPSNGRSKSFLADLDWLTKESHFMHIVEGKYDA